MHIYLFSESHISSLSSPRAAQCCVQKNVTQHSAADNQTEYNFDNSCLGSNLLWNMEVNDAKLQPISTLQHLIGSMPMVQA